MRKLSQILKAGLQFYSLETKNYSEHSEYMCHALALANEARLLTVQEVELGRQFCKELVTSMSRHRCTLFAAIADTVNTRGQDIDKLCCLVYGAVIDKLEEKENTQEKEKQMTKIRHYRNINTVWKLSGFVNEVSNLGGATIAYRELNEDAVLVGLALCVENFDKAKGTKIATNRLETMPVVVAKEDLEDLYNMEDLYFSDLGEKLETEYRAKGVHINLAHAWSLGLEA